MKIPTKGWNLAGISNSGNSRICIYDRHHMGPCPNATLKYKLGRGYKELVKMISLSCIEEGSISAPRAQDGRNGEN